MQALTALLITTSMLLVACASGPTELMQSTPNVVHTSEKPADAVARCIDTKWESASVFGGNNIVDSKTNESGVRVSQRFDNNLHFLALVSTRGTGSRTQVWTQKVMAIGRIPQIDDVASCQ